VQEVLEKPTRATTPPLEVGCSVLQGWEVTMELWRAPGAKSGVMERAGPIAPTMGARSYMARG